LAEFSRPSHSVTGAFFIGLTLKNGSL